MEQIYTIFLLSIITRPVVVGIGTRWWLVDGRSRWAANRLRRKFQNLGDLRGKTLAEITAAVGDPISFVLLPDNKASYSWDAGHRYHVVLRFQDDICQGVVGEIII
jgi:hypothetical protein